METIYWIQRFSNINTLATVFLVFSVIALFAFIIVALVNSNYEQYANNNYTKNDYLSGKFYYNLAKKWIKRTGIVTLICSLLVIFIPTEKEMYTIYGVGGTLDYLKNNEVAKKLPDKVIEAIDIWADDLKKKD